MRQMKALVGRNITLFLKNRTTVMLSFISILIVMGLYVVFLREFIMQSVLETGVYVGEVSEFTDRLMVSGLLIVLNITTCFGMMQLSVADGCSGTQRDFLVAPVSKFQLALGYWVSSILISFFFTLCTLFCGEVYFSIVYENRMQWDVLLQCTGTIFFASCMNAGLLLCMIRFMKDTTSFSTFGNLYGMMCGFLAGTYLPYAMYPERLREILFYFPPMQLTSVIRQLSLSVYTEAGELLGAALYQPYGITLLKDGVVFSMREQWSYLLLAMAGVLLVVRVLYKNE